MSDKADIDLERLKQFLPFDCLSNSHLEQIKDQIEVLQLPTSRLVFKRGDSGKRAHFLISGAVDLADADFQVRPLPADDDENYLAIDNHPTHTVNAITTEPSVLYVIDRNHLDLLMTWTQAAESLMNDEPDREDVDWMDALLGAELFAQLPPTNIQSLFVKFEERPVSMGEKIIQEGEEGDTFYVLKRGKALITREVNGKPNTVATLGAGDFFGEDALISDAPRNASITMTSDGIVMCLDKEDFQILLQTSVVQRIDEKQFEELNDEGDRACILLDVRHAMEFKHNRTPGARNIPLTELRQKARTLEKDFVYVVYSDGRRGELGAYLLSEAGLDAYVLEIKNEDNSKPKEGSQNAANKSRA